MMITNVNVSPLRTFDVSLENVFMTVNKEITERLKHQGIDDAKIGELGYEKDSNGNYMFFRGDTVYTPYVIFVRGQATVETSQISIPGPHPQQLRYGESIVLLVADELGRPQMIDMQYVTIVPAKRVFNGAAPGWEK